MRTCYAHNMFESISKASNKKLKDVKIEVAGYALRAQEFHEALIVSVIVSAFTGTMQNCHLADFKNPGVFTIDCLLIGARIFS